MKTQKISNNSFNGNIVFFERVGNKAARSLEGHISKKIGKNRMDEIYSLVKNENFDLYISRSEVKSGLYNIEADTSLVEVIRNRPAKKYMASVDEDTMVWLPDAARNAILAYKEFQKSQFKQSAHISKNYIQTIYNA